MLPSGPRPPCISITAAAGNGNVTRLFGTTGKPSKPAADHSPFGGAILTAGPRACLNPFRFSSKHTASETCHRHYGHHYCSPAAGRWPSGDSLFKITGEHPEFMEEGPNLSGSFTMTRSTVTASPA